MKRDVDGNTYPDRGRQRKQKIAHEVTDVAYGLAIISRLKPNGVFAVLNQIGRNLARPKGFEPLTPKFVVCSLDYRQLSILRLSTLNISNCLKRFDNFAPLRKIANLNLLTAEPAIAVLKPY